MNFNIRSLYGIMLLVGLSAVSVLGIVGFLNNVYADNQTMGDNLSMAANVNASAKMSGNTNMTNNENMSVTTSQPAMQKILSPLQQFKSGVSATSVQCETGFTLIIKIEDGSPACVNSHDAQALIARGWGTAS
jgi:hypothetical protein